MSAFYRTQGFILLKNDLREADQIFNIYTKDFGKLKVLARGIRKIKSKLKPGADLFYLSEIEFIQGRSYRILTDAMTIEKFGNIRNDLDKLKIAYQIAETSDKLIRGQEKDEKIWDLLNEVFEKLNNYKSEIIYYYFLWNLLTILGYQINLYACASCQKKLIPEKLYFDFQGKGIVCSKCSEHKNEQEIYSEVVKILRILLKKDWLFLLRLKITKPCYESLESISENYLSHIQNQ